MKHHEAVTLLPCPFCGHAAVLKGDDTDGWLVECPNVQYAAGPNACMISPRTLPCVSAAAAVNCWNTRGQVPENSVVQK